MARIQVEARIYPYLVANAAVHALVADRIYPIVAPQARTLPLLVYKRISTDRVCCLAGESGVEMVRIQIDCQAETHLAAKALAAVVLTAMDGATTFDSYPDGQVDGYESDPELYIVSLDFQTGSDEE